MKEMIEKKKESIKSTINLPEKRKVKSIIPVLVPARVLGIEM